MVPSTRSMSLHHDNLDTAKPGSALVLKTITEPTPVVAVYAAPRDTWVLAKIPEDMYTARTLCYLVANGLDVGEILQHGLVSLGLVALSVHEVHLIGLGAYDKRSYSLLGCTTKPNASEATPPFDLMYSYPPGDELRNFDFKPLVRVLEARRHRIDMILAGGGGCGDEIDMVPICPLALPIFLEAASWARQYNDVKAAPRSSSYLAHVGVIPSYLPLGLDDEESRDSA
ncbi:hypothetical protein ONZ45_g6639 [Pleurotus djamor]|nr:hypothetical protein ONZ45_g6639 [Pleurotus djamor]